MWEYNRVDIIFKNNLDLVKQLNTYGMDNWEVISVNDLEPRKLGKPCTAEVLMKKVINNK
jgi:hypothetical protein